MSSMYAKVKEISENSSLTDEQKYDELYMFISSFELDSFKKSWDKRDDALLDRMYPTLTKFQRLSRIMLKTVL